MLKKFPQNIISAQIKKTLKIGMLALMGTVLILSALFFSLRNIILKNILDNKIGSFQGNHKQAVLSIGAAKFSGLDRIVFENIRLLSEAKTLAIDLRSCSIRIAFWKLLTGRVRLEHLEIDDLRIDLYQDSTPEQNLARLAGRTKADKKINRELAYSAQVSDLLDLFFKRIPDSFIINRLTVNSDIDHIRQTFHIPQLAIIDFRISNAI